MQLLQTRRVKRTAKWRVPAVAALLVVLGVSAWQGWDALLPRYLRWKQERALKQAKEYIAKHDAPNAQLALEIALKTIPNNPETLRVAADMLEQVGAPQAMRLRRAVVDLVPGSADDGAALVMSCLRFRDYNAARDALTNIPHEQAVKPAALHAALAFALATDNAPVADALFQQLESDLPKDDNLKIAHNLLYLRHPKAERREQAHRDLEQLSVSNPALAQQIHREFAANALLRRDYPNAKKWFAQVLADPTATFTDRLQKANLDLLVDKQPFEALFTQLAPIATKNEADAAQFTQWLLVQGRGAEANRWLAALPAALQQSTVIKSARADAAAQTAEWDQLAALVGEEAWGPISKDTVRLAMAAHTVDTPARPSLRHETWELALDSARGNLATLRILQRLAAVWQWDDESERTLWTIARAYPDQTWAHQSLFNIYRKKKDTKGMRDVMAALREAEGTLHRYQHDWALLTLLTEPSNNWNPAKETMHQLYEGDPANATYVTGYAFALAQMGKGAEAVAIAEKLKDFDRDYPPRQPYLAFVYGVARKGPELERAVSKSAGADYLPEETYLFARARTELERKPEKIRPAKTADGNTPTTKS